MAPEMQQRAVGNSFPSSRAQADSPNPFSIPPWVHANPNEQDPPSSSPGEKTVTPPSLPLPPAHYKPGRKWDQLRTAEPALLSAPLDEHMKRWKSYMQSGPSDQEVRNHEYRVVSQAWLDEHMPYLSASGWVEQKEEQLPFGVRMGRGLMYQGRWLISPERQEKTAKLFWRLLLKNPYVPLVFRLTILAFSAASLGVAARIFVEVNRANSDPDSSNQCSTRASTYMAICVGAPAIPYVGYVTWDEYLSKPLGLRSVRAKISLLLCDLYFIVFSAANLSLAFDALTDRRWACFSDQFQFIGNNNRPIPSSCPNNPNICSQQKSLSALLMVGTCAWVVTFSLSVLRVVEKLRPD